MRTTIQPLDYFTIQMTVLDLLEECGYKLNKTQFYVESYRKKQKGFHKINYTMVARPLSGCGQVLRIHGITFEPGARSAPAIVLFRESDDIHAFYVRTTETYHWAIISRFLAEVYPTMKPEENIRDWIKPMLLLASI